MNHCVWRRVRQSRGCRESRSVFHKERSFLRQPSPTAARVILIAVAALSINAMTTKSGFGQVVALPQPQMALKDENGVDMLSFNLYLENTVVSIGSSEHPLSDTMYSGPGGTWWSFVFNSNARNYPTYSEIDSFMPGYIKAITPDACAGSGANGCTTVYFGPGSSTFYNTCSAPNTCTYSPTEPNGEMLTENSDGTYTYTKRDGTAISFVNLTGELNTYEPTEISYPDGRVLKISYSAVDGLDVQSVTRSDGLELYFTYAQLTTGSWAGSYVLTSVTAINNAYDCDPSVSGCSLSMQWPTATFSLVPTSGGTFSSMTITDSAGRVTRYDEDSAATATGRTVGIKLPSSTGTDNITYTYCDANCPQYATTGGRSPANYVLTAAQNGQTWNYTGTQTSPTTTQCGLATYKSDSPVGALQQSNVYNCPLLGSANNPNEWDPWIQMTNPQGVQFNAETTSDLIQNTVMPEGNQTEYAWDARGNLKQVTKIPKPGSPLTNVTLLANYNAPCANPLTCNEPNWVRDGNQNETDYTYNPANGEVATVTSPMVAVPGSTTKVQPQTNYTYAQQSAYVLNASGQYVASAPIWVRSTESYCRTSKATTDSGTGEVDCAAGTSDKVLKTYYYGPNAGPNNLFLRGVSVTASGQTRVTCYGYDRLGNRISVTTPNAGVALTSCP